MKTGILLQVENLKTSFNDHHVLRGVNFQVTRGEVVAVVGKSGAGKTLLLRNLAGLVKADAGEVKFHFRSATKIPVGFVFQKSPLFPWLTVQENLYLCAATETEKRNADHLLQEVGLADYKNHFPQQISGGMAQKVNLLRALTNNSELILLDEPFGSLDSLQRSELQQFTHDTCRDNSRSFVLVTHDIDEALQLSDRVLILSSQCGNISAEIEVTVPKPEKLIQMRSHPDYNRLYQQVLVALNAAEARL